MMGSLGSLQVQSMPRISKKLTILYSCMLSDSYISKADRTHFGLAYTVAQKDPVLTTLQYLHHPRPEDNVKPVTHQLALDLTQQSGVRRLQHALQHLLDGSKKEE